MRNILPSILYRVFAFLFWLIITFSLVNLCINLFTENGQIGSLTVVPFYKEGYVIPVNLKLRTPDSIVDFKKHNSEKKLGIKIKTPFKYQITKDSEVKNWNFSYEEFGISTAIRIKAKSLTLKILSGFNNYWPILFIGMLMYLLKNTFYKLKTKIEFTKDISFYIKSIAILLIVNELITFMLSIYFSTQFDIIRYIYEDTNTLINQGISLQLNPRLDINPFFIIVGLSLLVLNSLLSKGQNLQEENDLTI